MTTVNTVVITGSGAPNASVGTNLHEYESVFAAAWALLDISGTARDLIANGEAWEFLIHPDCPPRDAFCVKDNLPTSVYWNAANSILRLIPACNSSATNYIKIGSLFGLSAYNKHFPLHDLEARHARKWDSTGRAGLAILAKYTIVENLHIDECGFIGVAGTHFSIGDSFDNVFTGTDVRLILDRVTARPHEQTTFNAYFLHMNTGTQPGDLVMQANRCRIFDIQSASGEAAPFMSSSTAKDRIVGTHCDFFYRGNTPPWPACQNVTMVNSYAGALTAGDGTHDAFDSCLLTACASSDTSGSTGLTGKTIGDCYDGTIVYAGDDAATAGSYAYMTLKKDDDAAFQGFPKALGPLIDAGSSTGGLTEDFNGTTWHAPTTPTIGACEVESEQPADDTMSDIVTALRTADATKDYVIPLARGIATSHGDGENIGSSGVKTLGGDFGRVQLGDGYRARGASDGHSGSWDNAEYCLDPATRRWLQGDISGRPTDGGTAPVYPDDKPASGHAYLNEEGFGGGTDMPYSFSNPETGATFTPSSLGGADYIYRTNMKTGVVGTATMGYSANGTTVGDSGGVWSPANSWAWIFERDNSSNGNWSLYSYDPATDTKTLRKSGATAGLRFNNCTQIVNAAELLIFLASADDKIFSIDVSDTDAIGSMTDVTANFSNIASIATFAAGGAAYRSRVGDGNIYHIDGVKIWKAPRSQFLSGATAADWTEVSDLPLDSDLGLLRHTYVQSNTFGNMLYDATDDTFTIAAPGDGNQWVWAPSQGAAGGGTSSPVTYEGFLHDIGRMLR